MPPRSASVDSVYDDYDFDDDNNNEKQLQQQRRRQTQQQHWWWQPLLYNEIYCYRSLTTKTTATTTLATTTRLVSQIRLWRRRRYDGRRRGRRMDNWRTGRRRTLRGSVMYWSPSSLSQRHRVPSSAAWVQEILRREYQHSPVHHDAVVSSLSLTLRHKPRVWNSWFRSPKPSTCRLLSRHTWHCFSGKPAVHFFRQTAQSPLARAYCLVTESTCAGTTHLVVSRFTIVGLR